MENSRFIAEARKILQNVRNRTLSIGERRDLAIELASLMAEEARRTQTSKEKSSNAQLSRIIQDPSSKAFLTSLTDQCFRSPNPARVASQIRYLISKYGIPRFLSKAKRMPLAFLQWIGMPAFAAPLIQRMLRKETAHVILPGEPEALSSHIKRRKKNGVCLNINRLGEAILGEKEAQLRLEAYLEDAANPEITHLSVKISTLFSQINLLAWDKTLDSLKNRLKQIYHAAKQQKIPKFINLDMEEYRDLNLTVDLFQQLLDDAEFYNFSAGIVLQSYLPDSFLIQQNLTTWAMKRIATGGAPIKIRLVKGANLSMEKVEASLKGWPQAPYLQKRDADANFKRMLMYGCEPDHIRAVRLGVGSHNLFDIAYALVLRAERGLEEYVGFEMLEGMAGPMERVVYALSQDMLLYCPVAKQEEFQHAVAYLMRRLDENTSPENFLSHALELIPDSEEWKRQAAFFSDSCRALESAGFQPRRAQNRLIPPPEPFCKAFYNEPDTDWSLPQNRKWGESILREWGSRFFDAIPLCIGNAKIDEGVEWKSNYDPSLPGRKLYQYALGGKEELELAIQTSIQGFNRWSALPLPQRLNLLGAVAQELRKERAGLIGAMAADTGKIVSDADTEVSEAVDFALFYKSIAEELHLLEDIHWKPKGPILVASPWNFPCSIPAGGILAALAAGNSVIFKPAPEAVLVGWQLANCFWKAGIPQNALQFFCCLDDPIGSLLIQDARLAGVILTGATATAKLFLKLRPGLDLMAETGGKNSMIITQMADRDLAIRDLLQSAFGHAGQKCSACSLAILEKEVYDDPRFLEQLRDAAFSLPVGSAWDLSTRINPLICLPSPHLMRGLTTLEEGEEWLLKPKQDLLNPKLWSPGIKIGVKPGSFTHQTELFGPVLGIMRAKNLQEALSFANSTPYGLTAGLHSLDEREQAIWKGQIQAGNCYINRTITGAIVQRQPFGGCKESSFGPGAKAGGPNYVLQLMQATPKGLPNEREALDPAVLHFSQSVPKGKWDLEQKELWEASLGSYAFFWKHYFSKVRDPSLVLGQDNLLYYTPHLHQTLRFQGKDSAFDLWRVIAAALTCKAPLEVSLDSKDLIPDGEWGVSFVIETEEEFIKRIEAGSIKRLRLLSPFAKAACNAVVAPAAANGRIELLAYLREVVVSIDTHRYGYIEIRGVQNDHECPCRLK